MTHWLCKDYCVYTTEIYLIFHYFLLRAWCISRLDYSSQTHNNIVKIHYYSVSYVRKYICYSFVSLFVCQSWRLNILFGNRTVYNIVSHFSDVFHLFGFGLWRWQCFVVEQIAIVLCHSLRSDVTLITHDVTSLSQYKKNFVFVCIP